MSIFNNKGKIIGGSMAGAKKVISKEVAALQAQMDNLENQLNRLKIDFVKVLYVYYTTFLKIIKLFDYVFVKIYSHNKY